MTYHIGIIGHNTNIHRITSIIESHHLPIQVLPIKFDSLEIIDLAVMYVDSHKDKLDGLIYTGKIPYDLLHHRLNLNIPSLYLDHDSSTFERALLKASLMHSKTIGSLSLDSYDIDEIINIFSDLSMSVNPSTLDIYTINLDKKDFVMDLIKFHHNNVKNRGFTCAITGISSVYDHLMKLKVPTILLQPSKKDILNLLQRLINLLESISNKDSQLVVLGIEIDMPSEYNLIYENEYHLMREKTKVTEEVYSFAEEIQAAVVESGIHNYMLFSTRKSLEDSTENLSSFPLLSKVSESSSHTISVGIGFGSTAMEGKKNASKALNKALKSGGNKAYIFEDHDYSQPLLPPLMSHEHSEPVASGLFQEISERTGISTNTIFEFHCIKEQKNKELFTSKELSEAFHISSRSMNRLLKKLEEAGYVKVEANRMMSDSGRPTRILRLNL